MNKTLLPASRHQSKVVGPPNRPADIFVLTLLACGATLPACQADRWRARQAIDRQIEARQRKQEESARLYDRGLKAHRDGRLEDAASALQGAVAADARNAGAWMGLGVVAQAQDRRLEAAQAFTRAAALAPSRYEPHYNLGCVFESAGQYGRAIESYEAANRLAPDQPEVLENLARCYIRTHQNLDEASRLVNRAQLFEQRPDWRRWLHTQALRLNDAAPDAMTQGAVDQNAQEALE